MAYGILKVDTITFTDGGVDKSVPVSGLVQNPTFTGNIIATGTISGDIIQGGTTVSGLTVTGTTANFASGVFTTQVSGLLITGPTVSATTGTFTSLTGTTTNGTTASFTTGNFTSLTGTTTTGTTANFASGVFTTQVSGLLITGPTVSATTGTFTSLTGTTTTGTTANFASGVFTTQISGVTITGTTVSTTTGNFTSLTGTTATITSGIIASGTAALPSLAILSDPNTGIYSPGADQLAVATNGTEKLIVLSNGNVGIGTSAPQARLDLGLGVSTYTAGTEALLFPSSVYGPSIGSSNRTYLHFTGTGGGSTFAIGIHGYQSNNPAAGNYFKVAPGIAGNPVTYYRFDSDGFKYFADSSKTTGDPDYTPTQRFTIDTSGQVGIGTTSPSQLLHLNSASSPCMLVTDTTNNVQAYVFSDDNVGNFGTGSAHPLVFRTSDTEKARIRTDGMFEVKGAGVSGSSPAFSVNGSAPANSAIIDTSGRLLVGTATQVGNVNGGILQLGSGITFPATPVAATDVNTLDDYEEGTWEPTFLGSTTNPTQLYNIQFGRYVKIGNQVSITCRLLMLFPGVTGGTGDLSIGGLPFPSANITNQFWGVAVSGSSLSTPATGGIIGNNSSEIALYKLNTFTPVSATIVASDSAICITGWYQV